MKKLLQNISLFLFTLMIFSCSVLSDISEPENKASSSEYGVVSGYINNPYAKDVSRSATSKGDSTQKYFYKIIGERKESGVPVDSYEGEYSDSKSFTFSVKKGSWIFTVNCYLSDSVANIVSTKPVFSGETASVQVTDSTNITNINLQIVTDNSAKADINLPIAVQPASIKSCKVIFRKVGNSTPEPSPFTYDVKDNKVNVLIQDMPAGAYAATFEFYSGARNGSNVTGSLIYSTTELITVLNGINITEWDGVTLTITQEKIDGTQNHKVYVKSGETGSVNGIYMKPFGSVYDAYTYIKNVNDSTTSSSSAKIEYSIILLSDVTESNTIDIEGNSHPLDLTIESEGTNRFNILSSAAYNTTIINSTSVPLYVTFKNVLMHAGISGCVSYSRDTSQSGNLSIRVAGQTYIKNIGGTDGSTDDNIVVLDSSLQPVYEDASHNIKTTANGNTRVSNFTYIPGTYDATHVVISGLGLADNYEYIAIKPQTVSGVEKKWILCADGKMEIYNPNIPGSTVQSLMDASQTPEAGKTYTLNTPEELFQIAEWSKTSTLANVTFKQTDNINLATVLESGAPKDWTGIGTSSYNFSGIYDGGNFEIQNLASYNTSGLFNTVASSSSCEIKNIKIVDCSIGQTTIKGGICNQVSSGTDKPFIVNCHVLSGTITGAANAGGIIGFGSAYIINCSNNATVSGSTYAAGICGGNASFIVNCYNTGTIKTAGTVAGITIGDSYVINCYSYAELDNSLTAYAIGSSQKIYNSYGYEYKSKSSTSTTIDLSNNAATSSFSFSQLDDGDAYISHAGTISINKWNGSTIETLVNTLPADSVSLTKLLNGYVTEVRSIQGIDLLPWYTDTSLKTPSFSDANLGTEFTGSPRIYVKNLTSKPSSGSTVYVKDEQDLLALQQFVNSGIYTKPDGSTVSLTSKYSFSGVTIEQTADLDLSKLTGNWEPIGNSTSGKFEGIYVGNDNKIENMVINTSVDNYPGLFGYVNGSTASVSNVVLSGSITVTGSNNGAWVGALVSELVSGKVYDCISSVNITNSSGSSSSCTGGLIGYISGNGNVYNCINKGDMIISGSSSDNGGIIGKTSITNTTYIYNCSNEGAITLTSTQDSINIGGIIGNASCTSSSLYLKNSISKGSITNSGGMGKGSFGGIIGYGSGTIKITNCFNVGTISGGNTNYSICGNEAPASSLQTAAITNCYAINSYDLYCSSDNISKSNNSLFTLTTTDGTLTTAVTVGSSTNITSLLTAANTWVTNENATTPGIYKSWTRSDFDATVPKQYASLMASAPASGDTVYAKNANDLLTIAEWVNTDRKSLAGVVIEVTQPINLTGVDWEPIGNTTTSFQGTFNGNNIEITNFSFYTSRTNSADYGLFGKIENATIKKVIISGELDVTNSNDYQNINYGGIVGQCTNSTIIDCKNKCNIKMQSSKNAVGGIVGSVNTAQSVISNCLNEGTITMEQALTGSTNYAGGIAGYVGLSSGNQVIRNCVNKGAITDNSTKGSVYLGGIVGYAQTNSGMSISIENCANKGEITGAPTYTKSAAGILGYETNTKTDNTITNCFNAARISGAVLCTAIVGTSTGSSAAITYCYWDETKVAAWKYNTTAAGSTVMKTYVDSGYNVSTNIGGTSCHYVTTALNAWINTQADTSLYKTWTNISGGNAAVGYGEPALPIEN